MVLLLLIAWGLLGCARERVTDDQKITAEHKPVAILYHRTGGIAGTDDRVVIWPDGFVAVHGKILADGEGWISKESMQQIQAMGKNWAALRSEYLPAQPVMDAYTIELTVDGKTVMGSDLAPNLPAEFRDLFSTIEKVAGEISVEPKPAP